MAPQTFHPGFWRRIENTLGLLQRNIRHESVLWFYSSLGVTSISSIGIVLGIFA